MVQVTLSGKAAFSGTGNALANHITGNVGANKLSGLAGADTLAGGKGSDTLYGGADADRFVFKAGDGADTIKDFDGKGSDHDVIDLSDVRGSRISPISKPIIWSSPVHRW